MSLQTLLSEVSSGISNCWDCELAYNRRHAVPGTGPIPADLAIVGEAPGWKEDGSGLPFQGPAGELLTNLLNGIGIDREDVFICNVINCKPPKNRDPKQGELEACRHWLWDQLDLAAPKVVLAAGRYASLAFANTTPKNVRGTAMHMGGVIYYFCYHPAAALHNPKVKPELEQQFKELATLL